MYTGPRDIHQTPALKRARYATKRSQAAEVIVDWSANDDVYLGNYFEHHLKCRKSIFALLNWQVFLWRNLWKYKPRIIFNMSMLSFFPIFFYSFFRRVKVVYDCRDYLAVSYKWPSFVKHLIQLVDNITALFASKVVIPDEYGYEYFYMLKPRSLYVVHNTVEDYGLRKISSTGPIRLAYFGYLSKDRNFDAIFDYVRSEPDNIELHIACNVIPDRLQDIIPRAENIILHGALSHRECHGLLSKMDYCLMMYDAKLANYQKIQPTKFYDCLTLGLPFICSTGMTNLGKHVDGTSNLMIDYGTSAWFGLKKTEISQYNLGLYPTFSYQSVVTGYREFFESLVSGEDDILL
jgi:hypothetical protein